MYKLTVCDFDGTLFRSDFTVSEKTKTAVARYVEGGGVFAIATGRLYRAIRPYVDFLGLKGYVIVYQGAGIYDIATGGRVWHRGVDTATAVKAARLIGDCGNNVGMCFSDDVCYAAKKTAYTEIFASIVKVEPVYVDMPIDEYISRQKLVPSKILCLGDEEQLLDIAARGRERIPEMMFNRSAPTLLEMVAAGTGKGNAVKWLAEKLKIDREEVVCIGDAENDISMIRYAGLGVAMGNAMPEVKAAADVIADTNDRDGVAQILEKYCTV